jgi:hypothetical protein
MEQFNAGEYQEAEDQFRAIEAEALEDLEKEVEALEEALDFALGARAGDGEFSLDALLQESLREVAATQKAKAAKKALKTGLATAEEAAMLQQLVANWEIGRLWLPRATVVMFDVQRCTTCGAKHSHFIGRFQRQEHRTSTAMRWVRASEAPMQADLPEEVKENEHLTDICASCYSN